MFKQGRVPLRFFTPCGTDLQFSYFFILNKVRLARFL